MSEPGEYILGTRTEEIERLGVQHESWAEYASRIFEHAGFGRGDTILDLGCGPGFTSFDLAAVVGTTGTVVARDKSRHFLDFLTSERKRRNLPQIEPSFGPVEELDLPRESLDGAYSRWLFCWLSDPGDVLDRIVRALKPGGVIVLQEYLDWGAMKLIPASDVFDRVVEACMKSWVAGGVTIDFTNEVPALAEAAKLEIELFRPVARLGYIGPFGTGGGSAEWRWVSGFFDSYLPGLLEKRLLTAVELETFRTEINSRIHEGRTFLLAPVMADVILRKS